MKTLYIAALALAFALAVREAHAGRVVTPLDGNDWTLDGLPVLVPNSWNKLDASDGWPKGLDAPRGDSSVSSPSYARRKGVYSRALPDAMPGRRYFLRCEGASQVATVRVNGVAVGTHKGAFTAFCFEVTDVLRSTGNKLEVEVSNEYDPAIPPASGDFSMCGGLYRSVWLVETDPVCIDPTIDGASGVRVFAETNGMVRVEADVSGADNATIDWSPKSIASPILWSPETPQLYTVRVTVRKGEWSDAVEETFGFRTAELRADGFYLNGVKRKVRGVNRHQDLAGMGWEVSPAQEERDVRLIRAMGADGARLCHYPQSRTFLDACDKHGLMVWSEIPVVDRISSDTAFTENALTMLREMIAQRRNHPSVCWWGVWNELYNNCERQGDGHLVPEEEVWVEPVAKLVAETKAQDPSRPVVAASNMRWRRKLNALQYVCLNTYPGWYFEGSMKAEVDDFAKVNNLTTLAISEYGGGGSVYHHENPAVHHGPYALVHNEEVLTKVHMDCYRDIAAHEKLWGSFAWQMFDCASDSRHEGDCAGVNDKGLVTQDRTTPKDAYFFYKANWNPEPMLHLCGKRMASTTNSVADVVAFSNVGAVKLEVNGAEIATAAPDEINAVVFRSVSLKPGANRIRVTASNLSDECTWKLRQ